jgi:hypothetical protein
MLSQPRSESGKQLFGEPSVGYAQGECEEDMARHGTISRGSSRPLAKLNEQLVAVIKQRLASGDRQRLIADQTGVTQSIISGINTGKLWKHVG